MTWQVVSDADGVRWTDRDVGIDIVISNQRVDVGNSFSDYAEGYCVLKEVL